MFIFKKKNFFRIFLKELIFNYNYKFWNNKHVIIKYKTFYRDKNVTSKKNVFIKTRTLQIKKRFYRNKNVTNKKNIFIETKMSRIKKDAFIETKILQIKNCFYWNKDVTSEKKYFYQDKDITNKKKRFYQNKNVINKKNTFIKTLKSKSKYYIKNAFIKIEMIYERKIYRNQNIT